MSTTEAIRIGTATTGRLITAAALVLAVVAGAFVFSDLVMMKYLAFGLLIALLLDATIVRMFLVPAIMKLLGDDCWWAPRWMKRLQNKLGLGEIHLPDERKRPRFANPTQPSSARGRRPRSRAAVRCTTRLTRREARPRPRTVGRTAPPAPQDALGRRHRADARPDHPGGGRGRRGGADDPIRGGPQRRQERGEQRCGGRGPAPHRSARRSPTARSSHGSASCAASLPQRRARQPAADDATTAIPTQAEPVAEDETATISAEETRAIPVSRPEPADNEVATEKLNARGKNAGDDRRRGGGVSAQDLLRREGRL